jgi:hypothetical protein
MAVVRLHRDWGDRSQRALDRVDLRVEIGEVDVGVHLAIHPRTGLRRAATAGTSG